MGFLKNNVGSQTIRVFAFTASTGAPATGEAANITAVVTPDSGTAAATNDTNPTELNSTTKPGIYEFAMTQAETNVIDYLELDAVCSTAGVEVITLDGPRFHTSFDLNPTNQQQLDDIQNDLTSTLLGFTTAGTINDASPATTGFTISANFVNSDDHYNNLRCYILSGNQKGRRAIITDQVGLTLTLDTLNGLTAAPEDGANIAIMS